jgi:hypothetical protein
MRSDAAAGGVASRSEHLGRHDRLEQGLGQVA